MADADLKRADALEAQYDPEMNFRPVQPGVKRLITFLLIVLGVYHFYTAGFGIPREQWHKGIHLGAVLLLIFLTFAAFRGRATDEAVRRSRFGGVPLLDWVLGILALVSALYIPATFTGLDLTGIGIPLVLEEMNFRIGAPAPTDLFFGTILVVVILEATRRAMGLVLPLVVLVFMLFALFGPSIPVAVLQHPGATWPQFLNHIYLTTEGIYGVPVKVISTIVFHFVLFGVIAQRMGLGKFFIDIAQVFAGRFSGGPAKVSVVSSSLFGTISGSSIANTVTTGSLTIPAMKRVGYPAHFAGAVEAASSTGGQITPPIMGAAAFLMVEFLEIPYTTIILAAMTPAIMHYVAVLAMVHFEAKKLGLKGMEPSEIPRIGDVLRQGWHTTVPLVILIYVLFSGYTPYLAAFWGISSCIAIGWPLAGTALAVLALVGRSFDLVSLILDPTTVSLFLISLAIGFMRWRTREQFASLADAFAIGSKYALAVGAAGAAVGIVVGVITLTGVTFRLGYMVTQGALSVVDSIQLLTALLPFDIVGDGTEKLAFFGVQPAMLFVSLLFIAISCVLMGAGLPTTALYIMLSAIATPALAQLGVPPLAAHLFVLYYGVLADLTPPVCVSAYAAGGIAGANPFKTGVTAFRLGNAKVLVPFVFVYSPAMLIVIPEYFSWPEYASVTITCLIGIVLLGAALTGYLIAPMGKPLRILLAVGAVLIVAPSMETNLWGLALAAPVLVQQWLGWRRAAASPLAA
ncbi:TRAP transporter 4TM/12TM fusion protein [Constrictibacter sp. MBR-5]|jgi:TRAP transporter 4TM/12TM fusion protein|uniref:TRAP transporter permease n=1 Tax=Constrictibacter sp. MBR-5 TaxID=3156467 RepID=UPI003391FD0B